MIFIVIGGRREVGAVECPDQGNQRSWIRLVSSPICSYLLMKAFCNTLILCMCRSGADGRGSCSIDVSVDCWTYIYWSFNCSGLRMHLISCYLPIIGISVAEYACGWVEFHWTRRVYRPKLHWLWSPCLHRRQTHFLRIGRLVFSGFEQSRTSKFLLH